MSELDYLVSLWERGLRSHLVTAYENRPHIFDTAKKGTHPAYPLYRRLLMDHHILGEIWDKGKINTYPVLKLETWYSHEKYCNTPPPITKYIFEVTLKKKIFWPDRVIALEGGKRVICKEQIITPEDFLMIENDEMCLEGNNLNLFLQEFRRRHK